MNLDQLDTDALIQAICDEDARVPAAVAAEAPRIAALAELTVQRIRAGGRLIYVGAGTSGRLGALDAAECPPTFGVAPGVVIALLAGGPRALQAPVEDAEDNSAQGAADLADLDVTARDVVLGIAASGSTPYVLGALAEARRQGGFCAALTCTPDSLLAQAADLTIAPLVGPEILRGSTRMKAGTAQKLVLNALSTAVMIRLGHVYGQLMIDVQPTNRKLRARACAITARIAGIDADEATALLEQTGYRIRPAVVMALAGCDAAAAQRRLDAADGNLRTALAHMKELHVGRS